MNEFIQAAADFGLIIDKIDYGRWCRCGTKDHPKKKNGSFFIDQSGDFGHYQDWASMSSPATWMNARVVKYTPAEREAFDKKVKLAAKLRQDERERNQKTAAFKARQILDRCIPSQHRYLTKKGFEKMIGSVLLRDNDTPLLCIPMRWNGVLVGLQMINEDGEKRFLFGQQTSHATHDIVLGSGGKVYLTEGYASGIALKAILQAKRLSFKIVICFSVGNLKKVVDQYPGAVMVADHDFINKTTGTRAGHVAALDHMARGGEVWMHDDEGFDVNDFYKKEGVFRAAMAFDKFFKKVL